MTILIKREKYFLYFLTRKKCLEKKNQVHNSFYFINTNKITVVTFHIIIIIILTIIIYSLIFLICLQQKQQGGWIHSYVFLLVLFLNFGAMEE